MKTKFLNELLDPGLLAKDQTIEELRINKVVYDSRKIGAGVYLWLSTDILLTDIII